MDEKEKMGFKKECEMYLSTASLDSLRAYGRFLQLKDPTKKKKAELIQELVMTLCGEMTPRRSNKGAPIKNDYVEPKILDEIDRLKRKYHAEGNEETEEVVEHTDSNVLLQLVIQPSCLNKKQKQLLNNFLNSL